MAKHPKPRTRRRHFFKEWRQYCGLTQDQAVERLGEGWSQSRLSKIENGALPYTEADLYAAADAYRTTPTNLIDVNPLKEGEVVDLMGIIRGFNDADRVAAKQMLEILRKRSN